MPEELRLIPRGVQAPAPTLRDLVAVMFRHRRLAVSAFAAVLTAVLLYGWLAPSYRAEMKILVRRNRWDPPVTSAPEQTAVEREQVSEEEMNSEADLLTDEQVLREVVEKAGLAGKQESWLRRIWGDSPEQKTGRAVRRLGRQLNVEPVRKTTMITVAYESSDPATAARVLDCLAQVYLAKHQQVRRPSGESKFFTQQVKDSRRELEQAELQLMNFTRDEGVVSAAEERDAALQKMSEVEAAGRQTQMQIAETARRIQVLKGKLPLLPERITTVIRNADNPELLQKMKSALLDLELKRTDLLTRFEPTYRLVKEVDQQIAETRSAIANEELAPLRDQSTDVDPNHAWVKSELIKDESELSGLQARSKASSVVLAGYREETEKLGERAIRQDELLSDLKAAESEYLLYRNKREQARMGDALDQEHILNVAVAEPPTVPALPARSPARLGLLGLALAGTTGVGLAFAADRLDPAFRTPDEVVGYLGTPVLASLPRRDGDR
jgi:uncharacterized protein involved in exopolysaccharide biosynthesis